MTILSSFQYVSHLLYPTYKQLNKLVLVFSEKGHFKNVHFWKVSPKDFQKMSIFGFTA